MYQLRKVTLSLCNNHQPPQYPICIWYLISAPFEVIDGSWCQEISRWVSLRCFALNSRSWQVWFLAKVWPQGLLPAWLFWNPSWGSSYTVHLVMGTTEDPRSKWNMQSLLRLRLRSGSLWFWFIQLPKPSSISKLRVEGVREI